MKYLHTMIRVRDLDAALDFFVDKLGLVETRRKDVPDDPSSAARRAHGVRALARPDLLELLQRGGSLPPREPWASMPSTGEW